MTCRGMHSFAALALLEIASSMQLSVQSDINVVTAQAPLLPPSSASKANALISACLESRDCLDGVLQQTSAVDPGNTTATPTSSPTASPTATPTFSPTASPTLSPTVSPTAASTCGTCVIWGDPHIITFKSYQRRLAQHPRREEFFRTRGWETDQLTIDIAGTFWLVRNDDVKIQGIYGHDETLGTMTLRALAVGGRFLRDQILVISPLDGKTTWQGQEILATLPSDFSNSLVHATYHKGAKLVKDGSIGPGIDVTLPLGVTLIVNRWQNGLAVEINMCPTIGQHGHCGSNADDSF